MGKHQTKWIKTNAPRVRFPSLKLLRSTDPKPLALCYMSHIGGGEQPCKSSTSVQKGNCHTLTYHK